MTPSAIGCRGWGSGRAGRIRTLRITPRRLPRPAIALDDRPPTALAEPPPPPPLWMRPRPPAEEKASLRREATSWDDGCSLTISNANVRSERERIPARSTSSLRRVVPTRGQRATRGCVGASGARRASWSRTLDPRASLDSIAAGGADCLTCKVLT
jgi:hypothetical protein